MLLDHHLRPMFVCMQVEEGDETKSLWSLSACVSSGRRPIFVTWNNDDKQLAAVFFVYKSPFSIARKKGAASKVLPSDVKS